MQACPVDAILGSAQKMHTVIADECIGCKLCLPPCPVDCIDLLTLLPQNSEATHQKKAAHIKSRYVARQKRLAHNDSSTELDAQTYIKEAIARVKK
jgi:electron transport complex protein RnfB